MGKENKNTFKGILANYAGLPRSIYVLFIARVINRLGGFVHAFLTLFLTIYLGMSESQIGTYVLSAGVAGFFGSLLGGKMGDHFSRKKVYLGAQSISAMLFIPCAYFVNYDMTLIPYFLIASSFFSAIVRPVNTAMVADIAAKEDRKRTFSLLYLGINFGGAIGPMIAAFLLENYLVWFFLGDTITTFIAVILVGVYVEDKKITVEEMDEMSLDVGEQKESGFTLIAFFKRPILFIFVFFAVINAMIYAQTTFAFPLLLEDIYADTGKFYAQLCMINAAIVIIFTAIVHLLTQKVKPVYNIAIASVLYSIGLGMMAVISSKSMFVISIFIWTIGEIQAVTNQNVFLMAHTPINYRARFMALISIITSAGFILSPKIGGIIIEKFGQPALWQTVAVGGIIAAVGFTTIGLLDKNKVKRVEV